MHRDTLNAKYDADAQVKRLVWSMGKTFQKLSANNLFPSLYYVINVPYNSIYVIMYVQ